MKNQITAFVASMIVALAALQLLATEPLTKGQRLFFCGHSFHFYVPTMLDEIAKSGGFIDQVVVGKSMIGGSKSLSHWDVKDESNAAKKALQAGSVDVLTLTPIYLPDDGVEKFAQLGFEKNPNIRVTVQEFWLPFDQYEPRFYNAPRIPQPKTVDHNAATSTSLRTMHQRYFDEMDGLIRAVNQKLGKPVLLVVPCGQAVIALREKIAAGEAPGLKTQEDLFTDPLGHPNVPLCALVTYCHYAVIYRKSPVGLPVPALFSKSNVPAEAREKLNRLLQEVAWDAVTHHPLSGVHAREMVDCINPMIGAITLGGYGGHGLGKTFPGAATPFGMIQLSPDTITGGDNGPGYSHHHTTIEGFSFTHMSGIGWYGDLGNFQVMPTIGERMLDRDKAKSPYSHDQEKASAAYYSVDLLRYGIKTELTAAPRAGIIRFTYPEAKDARIQIDLGRRIGQKERWLMHSRQSVRIVDDHTIEGFMLCSSKDGGWGRGGGNVNFTQHFSAVFSKPIKQFGVWDKDRVLEGQRAYEGTNTGFYVEFATKKDEQVFLRAGFSYVSVEGARANLAHDIPDFNFDKVLSHSRGLWADALKGVACEGGTDAEREIFTTALYHCMIDPRSISDTDGQYIGADNLPHRADGFVYRSIFSGWDVFRSQFPLLTIIRPDVVNDEINSLLQMAQFSKRNYLERWELLNAYSGCMLGNPAVSVIVDAYQKGIRGYDVEEAYRQCKNSVEKFGNGDLGYTPGDMSRTLEYAYSDWCMGRFAKSLEKSGDQSLYYARSLAYTNIWNAEVKWMRSRLRNEADGTPKWTPWKEKTGQNQGTTESNPYQQGWFVPHNVQGLIDLMGEDYFVQELTTFFDKTPDDFLWNDYYNHPNEPCHHVAFLFNYVGMPWLTQKWTRKICQKAYGTGVRGLCGNEDVGQMSAWYVLAAMGLHPVCPGDGLYQLTSPVFSQVSIRLDPKYYKGGSFTVIAKGNSEKNIYIQSATLNNKPLNRAWITHEEVAAGGKLEYVMGPEPSKTWGASRENRPPSLR